MNRAYIFLVVFLSAVKVSAQQNHFIYIQTEGKQAFYVKIADRFLSSSPTGYLVISKLQDGPYDMEIGFPKNEWPVQRISISVKGNDGGYVLKNFEDRGWGLLNMQTMDVIMSSGKSRAAEPVKQASGDGFADVLSDVVNTQLNSKPAETKEEPKVLAEPVAKTIVTDIKPGKAIEEPAASVVKIATATDATGISAVYADSFDGKVDTIMIFIPVDQEPAGNQVKQANSVEEKNEKPAEVSPEKEPARISPETKADKKFLDIELPGPGSKDSILKTQDRAAVIITNSDCKLTASNDDFLKLRKKMAAGKSDEDMVDVARKAFRSKCFSTEQVNNLSVLFLKDEGKYNFFDAAYPRVSDTQNFPSLISKLTDDYYITRFKAMIRH